MTEPTYSDTTYSSTTYYTDEAQQQGHAMAGAQSGFMWRPLGALRQEKIEEIETPWHAIPVIAKSTLCANSNIAIKKRSFTRSEFTLEIIDKKKLEQELSEILEIAEVAEAFRDFEIEKARQDANEKSRKWRKFQDKTQREYWRSAGYCMCDRFDFVHSLRDCDSQ